MELEWELRFLFFEALVGRGCSLSEPSLSMLAKLTLDFSFGLRFFINCILSNEEYSITEKAIIYIPIFYKVSSFTKKYYFYDAESFTKNISFFTKILSRLWQGTPTPGLIFFIESMDLLHPRKKCPFFDLNHTKNVN